MEGQRPKRTDANPHTWHGMSQRLLTPLSYDDANDILTIDTTALNQEEVEDTVAGLVTAGTAITVNYDDANDALSIGVNESALSFYDGSVLTANVDNGSTGTVITGELFVVE